jgi:hypothetical protein
MLLSAVWWKVKIFALGGYGKLAIFSGRNQPILKIFHHEIVWWWFWNYAAGSLLESKFVADFWRSNAVFREKMQILNFVSITKKSQTLRTGLRLVSLESSWSNLVSVVGIFPLAGAV